MRNYDFEFVDVCCLVMVIFGVAILVLSTFGIYPGGDARELLVFVPICLIGPAGLLLYRWKHLRRRLDDSVFGRLRYDRAGNVYGSVYFPPLKRKIPVDWFDQQVRGNGPCEEHGRFFEEFAANYAKYHGTVAQAIRGSSIPRPHCILDEISSLIRLRSIAFFPAPVSRIDMRPMEVAALSYSIGSPMHDLTIYVDETWRFREPLIAFD